MAHILRKYKFKINIFKMQFMLFMLAIVIGAIFANRLSGNSLDEYKLWSGYFLTKFPESRYLNIELFKFIVWKRMKLILGVWLLGFTFFEVAINYLLVIYFGFSIGFLFSIGLITNGFKGYLMYFVMLLPQYIFYVPVTIYLIVKSTNFCQSLYSRRSRSRGLNLNKQMIVEYLFVLVICVVFIIVGSIVETYINPQLVKWYISVINM